MKCDFKDKNYILTKDRISSFKNYLNIGDYKFQYQNVNVKSGGNRQKKVIILGEFVNSHNGDMTEENIINDLLSSKDIEELIYKSKKLAGRFIIVFNCKEKTFVVPDAISSIHTAYTKQGNELCVSSNPKIIADINNFKESSISQKIKASAANMHPLPYEMTMYDEIKFVIPNHYLECNDRYVKRYFPLEKMRTISSQEAAKISTRLLLNIMEGYNRKYKLSFPLTAGIDSRLILAISKKNIENIPMYTFFHDNFNENTGDIYIPKEITNKYNLNYSILKTLDLPDQYSKLYKKHLGSSVTESVARNSWTYCNSKLKEYTFMTGDVVTLAKSDFGKNLPECLATTNYLVTKTHNYSKENKKEVKRWINDINYYTKYSGLSKFDMFYWEHRAGKWSSNSLMNYDLLTDSTCPFNCRELVETWLMVPRKERMKSAIHHNIIEELWPELLNVPINPGDKYKRMQGISILYYIGSRIKYIIGKNKY